MILSVYEVYPGTTPHGEDGLLFWTYLICEVEAGRHDSRFNLIRIDNCCKDMETLGRELTLEHCRRLIDESE